jgi:peptidoglycan lytic transglycosylase
MPVRGFGTLRSVDQPAPHVGARIDSVSWLGFAAPVLLASALAFGLSGCGAGGNGQPLGERVIPLGQPVPKGGGYYQIGKPYQVAGQWYTPREDPAYDRVGSASWYGELFHGRRTANGEIYDMDRLSAAHPTLPLPTYARVTNLNNGRSIVVRINDRGPYARDRIIDLSKRSAELLGFRGHGTATVRVKYLGRAPLNGDDSYEKRYLAEQSWSRALVRRDAPSTPGTFASQKKVLVASRETVAQPQYVAPPEADPPPPAQSTGSTSPAAKTGTKATGLMIQAGTFRNKDNVERARTALSAIAPVDVSSIEVRQDLYFRVRVGPFPGQAEAKAALAKVTRAGYQGAKVVLAD